MKMRLSRIATSLLTISLSTPLFTPAFAQKGPPPATGVTGWVPNNGVLCHEPGRDVCSSTQEEAYLGDMWTFRCPPGGTALIRVDTKDDTDTEESCIDPVFHVFDPDGVLIASADEGADCTFKPVCGWNCPELPVACSKGQLHSVVVRDFGNATRTGLQCEGGGGYILSVIVSDKNGKEVKPQKVKLGGGARRTLKKWMKWWQLPASGPLLDDEKVPYSIIPKQ